MAIGQIPPFVRAGAGHLAVRGHVCTSPQKRRGHPLMMGANAFLFEMLRINGAFAPGSDQMISSTDIEVHELR